MAPSYRLSLDGEERDVEVVEGPDGLAVRIDGRLLDANLSNINGSLYSLLLGGRSYEVVAVEAPGGYEVLIHNRVFEVGVEEPGGSRRGARPALAAGDQVRSPMTGVVAEVIVGAGDAVVKGQVVVVVESMKMNNELRSPRDGIVSSVHVGRGERVERNAVLVTLV